MSITSNYYGRTADGQEVYAYLLDNGAGMRARIIEYGCVLTDLWVPDRGGASVNVVLGMESLADYEAGGASLGSFVGRYANRIEGARFTLDGAEYMLEANNGPNHLHGTFGRMVFKGAIRKGEDGGESLVLTARSPDGDDGFPGNMDLTVTYTLTEKGALVMDYQAVTDAPTLINLTNHSYFNLEGDAAPDVYGQTLIVDAERFLESNAETCPTGRVLAVAGTPFDFRCAKPIGKDIGADDGQLRQADGYDHCFVLDKAPSELARAAKAHSPKTGISMEVYTTQPGMQLYTANFLQNESVKGRDGRPFGRHQAFCLETQHYPCTPSHPEWPGVVLRPGEEFHETTAYSFYTE